MKALNALMALVLLLMTGCGASEGSAPQTEEPSDATMAAQRAVDGVDASAPEGRSDAQVGASDAGVAVSDIERTPEPSDVVDLSDAVSDTSEPPVWELIPCETDVECPSGLCLPSPEGMVCGLPCVDLCPEGWACHEVALGETDMAPVCVHLALNHCDPCMDDSDCVHPLLPEASGSCLSNDPAEGAFCRVPCVEGACPEGSSCQETEVGGVTLTLCFPEDGLCACSPYAIASGAQTWCEEVEPEGTCESSRVCTSEGLSPCGGSLGSPELCDGVDNDCDGTTDEGQVYVGPDGTAVVGWGLPCGKGACQGGVTICGEEGALVCSTDIKISEDADCNGVDNDCDGGVDEDFVSGLVTTCGVGVCQGEGISACVDGVEEEACLPVLDNASAEVCDELDNDCDGLVDEAMPIEICDDLDNDCDGAIDEEPEDGIYAEEVCNGFDDDCDTLIDEGMSDLDADGLVDCLDEDIDGDSILNEEDNCPNDANPDQLDDDQNGIGDACDATSCGGFDPEAVILVTTQEDELNADGDCSLREAIQAANDDVAVDACAAGNGVDVISLGVEGGTYTLSIAGAHEDQNQSGDLDIYGSLTIAGCGADQSALAGSQLDRLLHVHPSATLQLVGLTLRDGRASGGDGQIPDGGVGPGFGGAIYNDGDLVLDGCTVAGNEALGGAGSDGEHAPGDGGGGGGGAGLGGAIYSTGNLFLQAQSGPCLFQGNVALGGAGGKGKHRGSTSPFTGFGGGGGGPAGGTGGDAADGFAGGFGGEVVHIQGGVH